LISLCPQIEFADCTNCRRTYKSFSTEKLIFCSSKPLTYNCILQLYCITSYQQLNFNHRIHRKLSYGYKKISKVRNYF
jgi:hypothetical protein